MLNKRARALEFAKKLGDMAVLCTAPDGTYYVETFGCNGYGTKNNESAIRLEMPKRNQLIRINSDPKNLAVTFFVVASAPIPEAVLLGIKDTRFHGITGANYVSTLLEYVENMDNRMLFGCARGIPNDLLVKWLTEMLSQIPYMTDAVIHPRDHDWQLIPDYPIPKPQFPNGELVTLNTATRYTPANSLFKVLGHTTDLIHGEIFYDLEYAARTAGYDHVTGISEKNLHRVDSTNSKIYVMRGDGR